MAPFGLSNITWLLILLATDKTETRAVRCNDGQIPHSVPGAGPRCCHPWPFNCPINYPYTICGRDGGWDECRKCEPGFIQPNLSNSSNPRTCFKRLPVCNSADQVPIKQPDPSRSTHPACVCDRANNYFPLLGGIACDFKPRGCPRGQELQTSGTCRRCNTGTYKDWDGYGLCIPWTSCESLGHKMETEATAVSDTVCVSNIPMSTSSPTPAVQPRNQTSCVSIIQLLLSPLWSFPQFRQSPTVHTLDSKYSQITHR